ncbi:hypothetical protein SAMN06265348_102280 [Pedobacter westerhofensis]|uniref:VWFA domain-containing protein n=1 Tax=Pedobacter westerhofensis TaxID=425512 RepID=A0A521BG47_9SPHI|nr:type VI secretion system protein TssR domain-containing protein [Pedobacter westerhofensis]SMO46084.1 hypothetical protein SAMN06265348_102280 [Pedobacter westerhofensis]
MKRIISLAILLVQAVFVMAQSPSAFGKKVNYMPKAFEKPSAATNVTDEGGKTKLPWVVFSDRDENYTTTAPGGSLIMKKLNFMEPFYVSKEENGYVKLIKYKAGMIRGRKINDKKSAISYGWIPVSKLLLWQRSYSNQKSGYPEKSIAIINGNLPLVQSKFYYDNTDSAYVYTTPELKKKATKVRLHEINYIFKKSEDGKKYLIGNEDQLVADSARKSIYGWIAADAVHSWGDRLYIAPAATDSFDLSDSLSVMLSGAHTDPLLDVNDLILRSAPVMDDEGGNYTIGVASDVYKKKDNKIITISGAALTYPNYLALRKNIHKINVIFVVDGGTPMTKYFAGLTNTIQSFENIFNEYGRGNKLSYGAVVYRGESCCSATGVTATPALSTDYRKLMAYLTDEAKITERCESKVANQPVYDGVRAGLNLLKKHTNETNLIVLVGTTGNANSSYQLNQLVDEFVAADARLLAIQMYSDYDQSFNNFVLQSKKLVSESAVYAAKRKRRFLVKGEGLNDTQAYNTSQLDSISYYLDYPKNSLIQGGVVFPTKGSVNSNESMNIAMRRFIKETDMDISNQISSLDSAFRLTGIDRRNLSATVEGQLAAPVSDEVADHMPHNGFKYYMTSTVPSDIVSKHRSTMQYALVLNSMEFKQLNDVFSMMTGQNLQMDQSSFRKKLVGNYIAIPRVLLGKDISKGDVRSMTLGSYLKMVTGLPVENELLTKYTVVDLKRSGRMPQADFEAYLKFLISSTEEIRRGVQFGQQFISNGKTYYYITENNFVQKTEKENP